LTTYNWIMLVAVVLGWAVTYGRLVQKTNEIERKSDKTDNDMKDLRAWGERIVDERKAANDNAYVRKDVYDAKHQEVVTSLKELCDLKLPAALARIETSQEQIIADVARLQISVQKLLEK
jgi:acetate kinase